MNKCCFLINMFVVIVFYYIFGVIRFLNNTRYLNIVFETKV